MSASFIDEVGGIRKLLTAVHERVIVLDEERVVRYINRVADGRTREDVLDEPVEAFVRPDSLEVARSALDAAYHCGEISEYDVKAVGPGDSDIWFRTRLYPVRRDGRTAAVVIFASDITELKRAQAEARDLKRLLPVCSWCDRIRNDEGEWEQVSLYLKRETGTAVSHSLCPECSDQHMGEVVEG